MRTTLHASKELFAATTFIGKLPLLIFIVLFCINGDLYAGIKPVYKPVPVKKGQKFSGKSVKKAGALALPSISYTSPQAYPGGIAIPALTPTSSGVAAAGYSAALVNFSSGFSQPAGVATDAAGNVYVADYNNSAVKKVPAGGGAPVILGSGFSFPTGVAVDGAGNVYVADNGSNAIKKIPAGGGPRFLLPQPSINLLV